MNTITMLNYLERDLLYQWIVKQFGPWKEWNKHYTPHPPHFIGPTVPPGKEAEWHEFCATFAKLSGAPDGKSIERMIVIPFNIPSTGPTRARHIRHMAAALKAGFIDDEDIARLYPATPA
jgi:hypothetical protein